MAEKLILPLVETNPLLAAAAIGTYGAVEIARNLFETPPAGPRNRLRDTRGLHPIPSTPASRAGNAVNRAQESLSRARDIAERIRSQVASQEEVAIATESVRQSARESENLVPQTEPAYTVRPGFVDVPLNTPRGRNVIEGFPQRNIRQRGRPVRPQNIQEEGTPVQPRPIRGRQPGRILPKNAGKAIIGGLGAATAVGIASTLIRGGGEVFTPPSTPGNNPITPTPPGGVSVPIRAPRAVGGQQFFQPSERGPQFFIPPFGTPLSYKNLVTNTRHDAYNLYYKNISIPTLNRI